MQAVKAYYDGRAFVPFEKIKFSPKQQAIVVVEDNSDQNNAKRFGAAEKILNLPPNFDEDFDSLDSDVQEMFKL